MCSSDLDARLKRHVDDFFAAANEAPDTVQRLIARALECAERGEREHRRLGAAYTGLAPRYRASVSACARAFVMRWYCHGIGRKPRTAAELIGLREDALFAHLASEHDHKIPISDDASSAISEWDYCNEVID